MNTSSKYESQPGSIANTPRNLNHSSHHIKGFQNFIKNIDILDEKPPIVEVIYEENKHKKRQSLLGSFIQSSTSNLRSSQSTKKTYDRSISNKLVTFTRSLMPIIKRKLLVSLYAIKESAIKQRHDEEFVLNSPPFKKEFLNKGNPKSKEIDLV